VGEVVTYFSIRRTSKTYEIKKSLIFSFRLLLNSFHSLFLPLANNPNRFPMLKFITIARPLNTARKFPLFDMIRVKTGVTLRNRLYSSNTRKPRINTNQLSAGNAKMNATTKLSKKEEEKILGQLILLVQARKFDDLFESLNDSISSLNPRIFAKLQQTSWKIPLKEEIELKEKVMYIMLTRGNQLSARNNSDERIWLTKEESAILYKLLRHIQARKFDDLFGSLNDSASLNPQILAKLIQTSWKIHLKEEIELKEKIMDIMWKRGVNPTSSTITPMISLYGKVGDTTKSVALLKMMKEKGIPRNPTIYTSLMKCHGNNTAKVDDLYLQMKKDGIKPNVFTYAIMIKAFSRYLVKVDDLYARMKEFGVKPNVFIYAAMIKAFSRDLDKVEKLYLGMKTDGIKPDVYTYATMIDVYAKNGKLANAIEMFASIEKEGIKPSVVTYNSMIDAYSKDGQMDKALKMFASVKREGMKSDVITFNIVLNCYAKNVKHLDDMMYILKEMKKSSFVPDIKTWTIVMDGFSRADGEKDQKKAISIWKYISGQLSYESLEISDLPLKALSVFPTSATLCIALDVCKHGQFEKEAHDVWNYGQENKRIVLNSNVLTSYVECLTSFGEKGADRAVGLILHGIKGKKMPQRCVKPDKKTIKHAIMCLKNHGWKKHAAKLEGIETKKYIKSFFCYFGLQKARKNSLYSCFILFSFSLPLCFCCRYLCFHCSLFRWEFSVCVVNPFSFPTC
jgi:pentatricopeptide repeat protein